MYRVTPEDIGMAVATVPKSEFRKNDNVIFGLGEIASTVVTDSEGNNEIVGWVHPNGTITFREREALEWAKQLDAWFKQRIQHPSQLLRAA